MGSPLIVCTEARKGSSVLWGAVISDHYYRKGMEGCSVGGLIHSFKLPKFIKRNISFLEELQTVHDDAYNLGTSLTDPQRGKELRQIGHFYDLDVSSVDF